MNWKRSAIAVLASVPVIALLAWGLTQDPHEIVSPLPGHQAPAFTLGVFIPGDGPMSRPVGDSVALAGLRGKVVVLNFWASWCVACAPEHPELIAAARHYEGLPVQFVSVLYSDVPEAGKRWVAERGGTPYPAMLDPGARTAIDYGLWGVPETFVIDPQGRVAFKYEGPITAGLLASKVDSILKSTRTADGTK